VLVIWRHGSLLHKIGMNGNKTVNLNIVKVMLLSIYSMNKCITETWLRSAENPRDSSGKLCQRKDQYACAYGGSYSSHERAQQWKVSSSLTESRIPGKRSPRTTVWNQHKGTLAVKTRFVISENKPIILLVTDLLKLPVLTYNNRCCWRSHA